MTNEHVCLSKWWQTQSAQDAIARAKNKQREKIDAMKARLAQRKAALDKEIWGGLAEQRHERKGVK